MSTTPQEQAKDAPKPDEFGNYRVAETIDGIRREYTTKGYSPEAHEIVDKPASNKYGRPVPPVIDRPDEGEGDQEEGERATEPVAPATTPSRPASVSTNTPKEGTK